MLYSYCGKVTRAVQNGGSKTGGPKRAVQNGRPKTGDPKRGVQNEYIAYVSTSPPTPLIMLINVNNITFRRERNQLALRKVLQVLDQNVWLSRLLPVPARPLEPCGAVELWSRVKNLYICYYLSYICYNLSLLEHLVEGLFFFQKAPQSEAQSASLRHFI